VTAIREIDLTRPPVRIDGLGAAERCMVVLRWRRRIVGRVFVDVTGGTIESRRLDDVLRAAVSRDAIECWLEEITGFDERAATHPLPLRATVAICTRERPDDLARALEGVGSLHGRQHDVLVVDNAPDTDRTRAVVSRWPHVRYVREDHRGLDAARNRALHESGADVVAFTDDDAVPEPEWIAALLANFQDPRVLCATGLTLPSALDTAAQELFEQHCTFVRGFRRRTFNGQHDNPLAVGPVGAGANMAVRREAVLALGGFDERLDAGTPARSGGDHELFTRVLRSGHMIVYDPAAVSWHRHRRSTEELLDTVYGYGVGVYAMWMKLLFERGELGVLRLAWQWLTATQLRAAFGAGATEARRLARAELRGCLDGPRAWLASRRIRARSV
jgi:GT2 family glycosyltransferase